MTHPTGRYVKWSHFDAFGPWQFAYNYFVTVCLLLHNIMCNFYMHFSYRFFVIKEFEFFIYFLGMDDEKNCICYFVVSFIHRVCIRENGK
ncbi:hypothetical protein POHY109586_06085 [Polaromonas hydrogenivorans]